MKKSIFALAISAFFSFNQVHAANPSYEQLLHKIAGFGDFSGCEKSLISSLPTETEAVRDAAILAIGTGLASGIYVAGIGMAGQALSSTAGSSMAVLDSGVGGYGVQWLDGGITTKGLVISAVATGVTIAAIAAYAHYGESKTELVETLSLLQFFRDVRNGGLGPQIEMRAKHIQKTLQELSWMEKLKRSPEKYSSETYNLKNIKIALMDTGENILKSHLNLPCENRVSLTRMIDQTTMKMLIEKYNPNLHAVLK